MKVVSVSVRTELNQGSFICFRVKNLWVGDMAQSVTCLSHQHEKLSIIPRDPH